MRDLNRTYPSHVYYQQRQGPGQLSLYNVLKAFSLYDSKVLRLSISVDITATCIRARSLHHWVGSSCPGAIAKLPAPISSSGLVQRLHVSVVHAVAAISRSVEGLSSGEWSVESGPAATLTQPGPSGGWSVQQHPVLPQVVNMQGMSSWAAWRYRCAPHASCLHVRGLT